MKKIEKIINALDRLAKATTGNLDRAEQAQAELRHDLDIIKARLSRIEKQVQANREPLPSSWEKLATHDAPEVLQ